MSLLLQSAYCQSIKRVKPSEKNMLKCGQMKITYTGLFWVHRQAHVKWCSHQGKTKINLEEFTLSVTSYISMYINDNYNKITPWPKSQWNQMQGQGSIKKPFRQVTRKHTTKPDWKVIQLQQGYVEDNPGHHRPQKQGCLSCVRTYSKLCLG